jgi:hypothetical protein
MNGLLLRALACPLLLMAAFQLHAQEAPRATRLLPVDEAAADPSWVSFKNRLLEALAARDRKHLLGILDQQVRSGLSEQRGVEQFSQQWGLDTDDSPLWRELAAALFLGGAYVKFEKRPTEFCAPYVAVKWPDNVDAGGGGAITGKEVLAKTAPSSQSDTVAVLSYDIVEVSDWEVADRSADTRQKWVRIRLRGSDAYVPEEQIRSPVEHAACFIKTAAGWRMIGFAPGGGN